MAVYSKAIFHCVWRRPVLCLCVWFCLCTPSCVSSTSILWCSHPQHPKLLEIPKLGGRRSSKGLLQCLLKAFSGDMLDRLLRSKEMPNRISIFMRGCMWGSWMWTALRLHTCGGSEGSVTERRRNWAVMPVTQRPWRSWSTGSSEAQRALQRCPELGQGVRPVTGCRLRIMPSEGCGLKWVSFLYTGHSSGGSATNTPAARGGNTLVLKGNLGGTPGHPLELG